MHSSLPASLKALLLTGAMALLSGCQALAPATTAQQPKG
ncbi:lipoprotein [Pseudomonas sp. PH1b]|nr:lipoprotein [Pseudomonas sp. PH1b]